MPNRPETCAALHLECRPTAAALRVIPRPSAALMKLHQLRYLVSVADTDLNITAAAKALHTSQPGVSKQLKMLEDELGFRIFVRAGRALVRVTPP